MISGEPSIRAVNRGCVVDSYEPHRHDSRLILFCTDPLRIVKQVRLLVR